MYCKNLAKRIIPFAIALMLGLLAASNLPKKETIVNEIPTQIKPTKNNTREENKCPSAFCNGVGQTYLSTKTEKSSSVKELKIISKPRPKYTQLAEQNNVQGIVTLRVEFLANGQVGSVLPVASLPYGLTNEAIVAAKQIKFEPKTENGRAKPVTKLVQYNFTIY